MGRWDNTNQTTPSTPASGVASIYTDITSKELVNLDDAGNARTVRTLTNAGSTTTNGADIYIVGSNILVPPAKVRVGSTFMWSLMMSKTAACTSAPIYNIRVGTAGAIGDTARQTWTSLKNQTAATDQGLLLIFCVVTTAGASGVINSGYQLSHNSNTAGFATIPGDAQGPSASAAFDLTVASLYFGLSINPGNTGANAVWTITCMAQGTNL